MYEIYDDPWWWAAMRWVFWIAICIGVVTGIAKCHNSEWNQGRIAAEERADAERRVPRVFSKSPDGCTVYQFHNGDRYQYFTRCPNASTTTSNTSTESCGKNCSRTGESPITN